MHERTRRNLCRLAFLAIGVLPTLCTCMWAAYRLSPWFAAAERAEWESRLFHKTGLLTKLERVEHSAGGTTLLHHLQISDPDGGAVVANIRQAEISYQSQGIVVLLSQPEVAQGQLLRLWATLHDRVLQGPTPPQAVQITTGELTLEVGRQAQTFNTVRCTIDPRDSGVRVWLEFQLAGVEMPVPAQLRIERNRQTSPPSTYWSLITDVPLPCSIFSDYAPGLSRLGSRAVFQGRISAVSHATAWSGEMSGQFSQVDLAQLTERLPQLSGLAVITMERAVVEQGVLKAADGKLVSSGGTVSNSLISSFVQHLPLSTSEVMLASHSPLMRYERLACRFSISADGFSLGGVDDAAGDVILVSQGRPLLISNSQTRYPLVALARALSPDSRFLVPATDQMKSLLTLFPFPAPQPPTNPSRQPVPPRLRMGNAAQKR